MRFFDKPVLRSAKLWHILVVVTVLIILATGYVPQIARYTRPDAAGRDNLWLHGWFAPDYHVYLSIITLGQHGYTLFRNPFTTENFQQKPYYLYYIAFGWITGPFHVWPPYVYHLAKLVAIIIFVSSIYYLSRVILKKPSHAGLATIIALVTTTLPERFYSQQIASSFTAWWQDQLYATQRLDNRPHYILSEGLLALAIAFYIRARQTNNWKFIIGTSISGVISALSVPHAVLPFLFIVGLTCGIECIKLLIKHATFLKIASSWSPFTVCIPTLFIVYVFRQYAISDPIWLSLGKWEVTFWNRDPHFLYHWYVTFALLLIPSIITWIWALRHKQTKLLVLAAWTIFPLLLSPFCNILLISKTRLLYSSIEIPLAISTTYLIVFILPKYIPKLILVLLTGIFILYSFTMIGIQSKELWNRTMKEYTWYSPIYVPNEYMKTIDEVSKIVPINSHVLTGDVLGSVLPSFNPIITFAGNSTETYKWNEKLGQVNLFYSSAMTDKEAHQFVNANGIDFVVDDMETKQVEPHPLSYPFLNPIWHNALVTLYKVQ